METNQRAAFLFAFLFALARLPGTEIQPMHKFNHDELQARLADDARTVLLHRQGLRAVKEYMDTRADLFPVAPLKEPRLLRREEKEVVWTTWQRFMDYLVALDSIERYHADFNRLKGTAKEDSFFIKDAAMLAKYRAALEFIDCVERNPELDKVLNDAVPELGLPAGTYARLKFQYLNVVIASSFAAHEILLKTFSGERRPQLREAIRNDAGFVWKAGRGRGELLTARNALKVIQNGAQSAWLPIQAGVAEWMGHTKVYRSGRTLITPEQIQRFKLLPGDILLERREWFMSNVGLPGFWAHAAIYLGTSAERRAFFDGAEMREWLDQQGQAEGGLDALLRSRYPEAYEESRTPREQGHSVRVIEAIGEGVSFTSLEHSAACDSLAVLRPRLPKREKAQALLRAFHYAGRPYDYDFDFSTDARLVCTELVYKSYEPAAGIKGLKFSLVEMLGRKVMPANEMARQFDAQEGTPEQQFDLVIFLDGRERKQEAVEASLAEFRESWKRPKWHVFVQE